MCLIGQFLSSLRVFLAQALLLSATCCTLCSAQDASQCTKGYINSSDLAPDGTWVSSNEIAFGTFPSMIFTCPGTVTGFRAWTTENRFFSMFVYLNGFSGAANSLYGYPNGNLIVGNFTAPVRITDLNQGLGFQLVNGKTHLAFKRVNQSSYTRISDSGKADCSIFGSVTGDKLCPFQPLLEFDFIPDVLPSTSNIVMETSSVEEVVIPTENDRSTSSLPVVSSSLQAPIAVTSTTYMYPAVTSTTYPVVTNTTYMYPAVTSTTSVTHTPISVLSEILPTQTTEPSSTSLSFSSTATSLGFSSFVSMATPTATGETKLSPIEGAPLTIIIPVCVCGILLVCILLLIVVICLLRKKSRRVKRVKIESMMVNSLYDQGHELKYEKTSTLMSRHGDNQSDDPSITGLVDTNSPCGTLTAEMSISGNTRELPTPPSPCSSQEVDFKSRTSTLNHSQHQSQKQQQQQQQQLQQRIYHTLERASGIYAQPEIRKSEEDLVPSVHSVEYANPSHFAKDAESTDNDYDDPDDFYYYKMPEVQAESGGGDTGVQMLTKMAITVPTLAERIQAYPNLNGWQQEGIYAVYQTIAKQKVHAQEAAPAGTAQSEHIYSIPPDCEEEVYKAMSESGYQELPRPLIKIGQELGRGQFASVYKGICTGKEGPEQVAVKMLSGGRPFRLHLLQEALIMGQFSHPNILKLHGVVTLVKPMMVVMEYADLGTLNEHLTKMRTSSESSNQAIQGSDLMDYSCQVAAGLEYLEKKAFVHRNLSAHNVLINKHNTCKITGFVPSMTGSDGLLSQVAVTKREENANIRWTAPEALVYGKYTGASDVWSYGMVLYEIWTVGRTPFEAMSYSQVMSVLNTGYCQPPPPGCPKSVYWVMVQCWNPEYRKRPSFSEVFGKIAALCGNDALYSSSESLNLKQSTPDQKLGSPPEEGMCLYMDLQKSYV